MEDETVEAPIALLAENYVGPRAQFLWIYLKAHEGRDRFTQEHLCGAIGLGVNGEELRAAVGQLERHGWLRVNRSVRPHRYDLLKKETEETTLW
jgi:hypothetical protein